MVMSAKYILASLLTVSRMLGRSIPRFIDFVIWFCITVKAKTVISVGGNGQVSDRKEWRIWEEKGEEKLNNHEGLLNVGNTQAIRIQGSREYRRCRNRFS